MRTENKEELEATAAALEPRYTSAGEAQIGRMLDRYGVPFFYEQPVLVLDRGRHEIWHPDFTLPDYRGAVIDYAGRTNRPERVVDTGQRQRVYEANGIAALVVHPFDPHGPQWEERLYSRIEQLGERSRHMDGMYLRADHQQYQ